ncbi:hypothetical protein GCM10020256_30860 [Streptomyces thermocoprophilus]
MPAGARISAGKFGSVDRSLPNDAVSEVNRSPVSCIPSPESPREPDDHPVQPADALRPGRFALLSYDGGVGVGLFRWAADLTGH